MKRCRLQDQMTASDKQEKTAEGGRGQQREAEDSRERQRTAEGDRVEDKNKTSSESKFRKHLVKDFKFVTDAFNCLH